MRRRGIVLELATDHAVVLSADGEFCRLPRLENMAVGAEVTWESQRSDGTADPLPPGRTRHTRPLVWMRGAAAGLAACLTIAAGMWWGQSRIGTVTAEAYAFLSIDINPSVALQVDQKQRVLEAYGLNDDGTRLLQRVHLDKEEPLKAALEDIMDAAVAAGMLPDEDAILISAAPASGQADVSAVQEQAEQTVKDTIQNNPEIRQHHPTVYSIGVSAVVWDAAKKANISPGKFAAFLIAHQEGKEVTLEDLHGKTLEEVLSTPSARSIAEILKKGDPDKVAQIVKDSHNNADVPKSSVTTPTEPDRTGKSDHSPPGKDRKGGQADHGSGSGQSDNGSTKGHGQGDSSDDGHGKAHKSGEVTVQLGNSVITVPVGPSDNSRGNGRESGDNAKRDKNRGKQNESGDKGKAGHADKSDKHQTSHGNRKDDGERQHGQHNDENRGHSESNQEHSDWSRFVMDLFDER
jgi:hypothetical protein